MLTNWQKSEMMVLAFFTNFFADTRTTSMDQIVQVFDMESSMALTSKKLLLWAFFVKQSTRLLIVANCSATDFEEGILKFLVSKNHNNLLEKKLETIQNNLKFFGKGSKLQ